MSLAETAILQMLVDPEIRVVAGSNIKEWMFESEVNKLALRIILDEYGSSRVDAQSFVLELFKYSAVTEDDCSTLARVIRAAPTYDEGGVRKSLKLLEEFIREKRIASVIARMSKDGITSDSRNDMADAISFALGNEKEFVNFSDPDAIAAQKAETLPEGMKFIKSYFDLINSSSIYGGYKYGDLIALCGETGLGKTTAAICEGANSLNQGLKVCHVFLGDMTNFDGFISYLSFFTGRLVESLVFDYEEFVTPEIQKKFQNLRMQSYPADSLNIYELESKLHALYKEFNFDLLIIDYDGNFKDAGNDSMYKEGGAIYNGLKRFSKGRCATIVLSQITKEWWGYEIGDKTALAESSKKQHAIDFMIFIGANEKCRKVGSATLCKVRRGRDNVTTRIKFNNAYARIQEITQDEYNKIIEEHKSGANSSVGTFDLG